jgi:hypothetical protein
MPDIPVFHVKREAPEPQGLILASLNFNPHDCWIGWYWKQVMCETCHRHHLHLWLIIVPCFPLHLVFGREGRQA